MTTRTDRDDSLVAALRRDDPPAAEDLVAAYGDLPGCPEVKVVMTGNLEEDPPEWSRAGYITTKPGGGIGLHSTPTDPGNAPVMPR